MMPPVFGDVQSVPGFQFGHFGDLESLGQPGIGFEIGILQAGQRNGAAGGVVLDRADVEICQLLRRKQG